MMSNSENDVFYDTSDLCMESMNFRDINLDEALRRMLLDNPMPKAAEQIDCLMTKFAELFYRANLGVFPNEDVVYSLSCNILMLSMNVHTPRVEVKMTKDDFINNNNSLGLPDTYLSAIYDRITCNKLEMTD